MSSSPWRRHLAGHPGTGGRVGGGAGGPVGALQADFNNDGADDLAVGVPGENVGSIVDAGSVNVPYGSLGTGLSGIGSQLFTQPVSAVEAGDQFGSALASGDFTNDGFADLAAGAPFEDVGATVDAGAASVLYGTNGTGLSVTGAQTVTQVGSVEAGDGFGYGLAAGDFNNDGDADLGVGAPFETVGGDFLAGAVNAVPGSTGGLVGGGLMFTQDSQGVPSAAEPEDLSGWALAGSDPGPATTAASASASASRARRAGAGRERSPT